MLPCYRVTVLPCYHVTVCESHHHLHLLRPRDRDIRYEVVVERVAAEFHHRHDSYLHAARANGHAEELDDVRVT